MMETLSKTVSLAILYEIFYMRIIHDMKHEGAVFMIHGMKSFHMRFRSFIYEIFHVHGMRFHMKS